MFHILANIWYFLFHFKYFGVWVVVYDTVVLTCIWLTDHHPMFTIWISSFVKCSSLAHFSIGLPVLTFLMSSGCAVKFSFWFLILFAFLIFFPWPFLLIFYSIFKENIFGFVDPLRHNFGFSFFNFYLLWVYLTDLFLTSQDLRFSTFLS